MYDRDLIVSQIRQRLEILYQMVEELERQGPGPGPGPGGTTNYNDLTNKPQIEGHTLTGNKTAETLGLATTAQLNRKVDKVEGSSLMTSEQASKLAGIQAGAEINVQANWSQTDSSADDYIKNKPAIPDVSDYYTKTETDSEISDAIGDLALVARTGSYTDLLNTPTIPDISDYYTKTETDSEISDAIQGLATVARTGDYDDLENKPTIPAAQVNSDWNASSGVARILNKPALGTAAAANTTTSITSGGTGLPTSGTVYTSQAAQDAEIGAAEERGSKNLLKIKNYNVGETYTYGGRKFTILADGGVKIETVGTVSSAVDFYLVGSWASTAFDIPAGQYKASLISTASAAGVQICVYDRSTGSTVSQLRVGLNNQSGTDFNFGATTVFISVAQNISTGENGVIVYPMIRPAAMKNPDFAPYAPTNRELYEMILALQA